MKAFSLCLPNSGSTKVLCVRFSDGFSGFWPKCVSGHSQLQFYHAYWVENHSARLFSHTSWKNDLPKPKTTSSHKLECFLTIFEIYSSSSYQDWKRKIGLKISHAAPRIARCTAISTNWGSDY